MYKEYITQGGQVGGVIRLSDKVAIPADQNNSDYQNYLKWKDGYEKIGMQWVKTSNGNTPEPADE